MTNAILRGKPDAGNPHVRFDAGEVASYPPTVGRPEGVATRGAKPRRGSLLYKKTDMALVAAAAAFLSASAANYTFVPTESDADWSLAANYRDASGNAPAQCPGASDTVTLPAGVVRTDPDHPQSPQQRYCLA